MNNLELKYINQFITIEKLNNFNVTIVRINNIEMFEDFVDIFNINCGIINDTYQWIQNIYGPICIFISEKTTTISNHGTWIYNISGEIKVVDFSQLVKSIANNYMVTHIVNEDCIILSK